MKRTFTGTLVAACAALAVSVAYAGSGPGVTITSPRTGSSVSLHQNPYLAVAGKAAFAAATPGDTQFFLRRDGCGTSSDNPHLSVTSGTDAGDGCGLIVDQVPLVGTADQGSFTDYPASDGMPLALDTSRDATGAIDLHGGLGAGLATVNVDLAALVGGQAVDIGADTESVVLDPTASDNVVAFTIHPDPSLAGADVQALDLRVRVEGASIYSSFVGLSGKSWVTLPSFAASVNRSVQVSVDDPTFANAVPARIDATGAWSAAIPTPAAGRHTIYAEAAQGFDTGATATTTLTVKR
jgi:hypothetical protein